MKRKWLTDEEIAGAAHGCGAAPGGVGVNNSAMAGYRLARFGGALMAVIGIAFLNTTWNPMCSRVKGFFIFMGYKTFIIFETAYIMYNI
ncbi:chromate transporter [Paenibacillus whitsoniae]|uniref:Uncharacterized protein n=1 Tax=Paenibacillus whitsoniae TaxID=2496558 RepID=A0A3S0CAU2_9BACL|nr:chromate transporter [Paenibacillus whitsoniae]RTE09779.1 hypothetical protein EJQ19_11080 [Paenibacillus whitsoniae]